MTIGEALDQADIGALRNAVRGAVYRPHESGYPTVNFNLAASQHPWAVIDAADAADVAAVIDFAAENSMTVGVHATGHGATTLDGRSLQVRTTALNRLEIDPAARTARIGAGVRWQSVLDAAAPHGLAPICGSAPGTGVIGFLTGGGFGPLVRNLGTSADHVRELTVVTGDGQIRRAAPDQNAELFWGLRGGKGTLGVVTEAVIDLLPVEALYGGALYFDGADAPGVLAAWRSWAQIVPATVDTSIALLRLPDLPGVPPMLAGRFTVAVRFATLVDPAEAEALLTPMRTVATPVLDAVGVLPYAAIGAVHADPADPMPAHEASLLLRELPVDAVEALLAHVGPDRQTPLLMVELRMLGGALTRQRGPDSALCHRDAAFHVMTVGVLAPPIAEAVAPAADALLSALAPFSDGTRLPNFTASADPAIVASCYDEDTRQWLSALARQHDPNGVLAVGQVVR